MTKPDRIMACLEVGKLLTSTHSLDDILELIMERASQLIEARNWSLLLQDPETSELIFTIVRGENKEMLEGVRLKPNDGIASHVTETGVPEIMSNVKDDKRFNPNIDKITGFITESIVCVPLNVQGKTLGVIEVINVNDLENFKAQDLPILTILADYAAIAIKNSQYIARVRKMSITDEYTGLFNARYMHKVLEQLILQADKSQTPIAVVFVDIDNFKTVVDSCGHLSGTHLLKEIGETISSCLEGKDILVKYGGDEYVMILPDTDRRAAVSRLENVLQSIRSSTYLSSEGTPVKITASFGVAIYPEDGATKKDILIAADNSMYKVKKSSKNGIGMLR
jgi:diguanylate cyclase (GGDEF)-like protein